MQNVIIVNPVLFEEKKKKFNDSLDVHVLADFDRTLTKAHDGSAKVGSAIAQIRNNNYLSEEYTKKAFELFDKYHPIEIDSKLTMQEKLPAMEEWWSKHLELIVASGMKKEIILDIVNKNYLPPRDGFEEFINFLNKQNIPILILSSGLGDIIEEFFKAKELLSNNVQIISNYFDFDEKGFAKGYKGKIVHVFNKDESQIKNTPHFEKIQYKKNIILLGDSLGDLKMTGQIEFNEIIRIGFLNENIDENLGEFKENFDIIITNDGSLEFVNNLLKDLFE
jgi:cytosolic 5'-nucleotidase 3